jgi:hypothetical protein
MSVDTSLKVLVGAAEVESLAAFRAVPLKLSPPAPFFVDFFADFFDAAATRPNDAAPSS